MLYSLTKQNHSSNALRKLVCIILQMAGKTTVEQTASSTAPVGVTVTSAENERFTLARQDASVHSRKSPLGRTDEMLELDDDELESPADSPNEDGAGEENESVGPLKKPTIHLYGLRSPTTLSPSLDSQLNNSTRGSSSVDKSLSLSNVENTPPLSPGRGLMPSTSVVIPNHQWKFGSHRSSSYVPNGMMLRQHATVDDGHYDAASSTQRTNGSNLRLDLSPRDSLPNGCNGLPATSVQQNGLPVESMNHNGEIRLQQSLSTPCPGGAVNSNCTRKESEYRRFKSEGSTGGPCTSGLPASDMDVAIDDLSPIGDHRSSPTHRLNLFQVDSVSNGPLSKHSHTEQVMMMHTLKTKLQKYQSFIDRAFDLIKQGADEQIIEGCTIVTKVMTKAWMFPKISHDLANALCDYLRDQNFLEQLINMFIKPVTCESVRLCCGRVLEECMSLNNQDYVVTKGYLKKVVATAEKLNKNPEQQRMSLSIMETLFKHSTTTTLRLIEFGVLDHILLTCKRATDTPITLRHAALALANLSLYSCSEAKKKIIQKKLPDWLFLLASQPDDITRYYASLAICTLGSSKELEAAVTKSGTLSLVEPFLAAHQPVAFASHDYKHSQGRPKEWLIRLLPMLRSKCREAKSMAAFHFAVEAAIKKDQQKLEHLQEIGAIEALKEVASSPDELAAKFASEALTIIGEEVPYKLSQQVPSWSISDVQYWVEKIGFGQFSDTFAKNMVDGDLLLLITEKELEEDLGMKSGLLRKRFMRELESLKIAADYGNVDESQLDQFLMSLSPELSVYTYQMLGQGLNRSMLPHLTNDMMRTVCGINNPIHRLKLRQALQDSKHIDDIEVAILSKQIDVFISYRRSTGNQLASLIKVLLQLRGYKVFIDVDKLYAGKFDSHLLKNIQAAKHFILVLTPHSLDRLLNDHNCEDWIHKELRCAFEHHKNVIPIFDQQFEFPAVESELPDDVRQITRFNGVRWVHDYQEACVDKVERFIKGELNRTPSIGPSQLAVRPTNPSSTRKTSYKLASTTTSAVRSTPATANRAKAQLETASSAFRSSSMEKRKKLFSSSVSTVYSEK